MLRKLCATCLASVFREAAEPLVLDRAFRLIAMAETIVGRDEELARKDDDVVPDLGRGRSTSARAGGWSLVSSVPIRPASRAIRMGRYARTPHGSWQTARSHSARCSDRHEVAQTTSVAVLTVASLATPPWAIDTYQPATTRRDSRSDILCHGPKSAQATPAIRVRMDTYQFSEERNEPPRQSTPVAMLTRRNDIWTRRRTQ